MASIDAIHIAERDVYFDDFGETIRVRANANATARSIDAVVERDDPPSLPGGGVMGLRNVLRITIKNHASEGVTSQALDVGTYQFELAPRMNDTVKWMNVGRIENHDAGTIRLLLK